MFKKEIYPKTKRIPVMGYSIQLTEKLDGSNMTIFKKNDELYIAQRKTIIRLDELKDDKMCEIHLIIDRKLYDIVDGYVSSHKIGEFEYVDVLEYLEERGV